MTDYTEYQETGIPWLGEIPSHWEVMRLKYTCELNPNKSELSGISPDTEVSFLPMEKIGEDGTFLLDETRPLDEVLQGYTYFRDCDVAVAKITPCFENGKGALFNGLVNGVGFGTTELHVLRANHANDPKFIFYLTRSQPFRHQGKAMMYGAAGQKRVPGEFFENFVTGFPPLSEQRAIAAFLDERTARIDAAAAEYRRLADLLREQRAALISHTVTQGLDPDVPRKESGIEWLGEIPSHWEVMRIKYLLHDIVDTEHKTAPFYPDGKYLVVRTSNIRNGQLVFNDAKYTDFEGFTEWTQRGVPEPGDILFTREAPAGEACIVPAEVPLCIGQRTVLLRVNQSVLDSQFALWSLYSGVVEEFIELLSQGSTVDHLNMADIPNIPIVYPPLPEQRAIAAYLDRETARIDAALAEIDTAIGHLAEYRAALIAAAVTGKINVQVQRT